MYTHPFRCIFFISPWDTRHYTKLTALLSTQRAVYSELCTAASQTAPLADGLAVLGYCHHGQDTHTQFSREMTLHKHRTDLSFQFFWLGRKCGC